MPSLTQGNLNDENGHVNTSRPLSHSLNEDMNKPAYDPSINHLVSQSPNLSIKSLFQAKDAKDMRTNDCFSDDQSVEVEPFTPTKSFSQPIFRSHSTPECLKDESTKRSIKLSPTRSESMALSLVQTPFTDRLNAILRTPNQSPGPLEQTVKRQIGSAHEVPSFSLNNPVFDDDDAHSLSDEQSMHSDNLSLSLSLEQSSSPDCLSPTQSVILDRITSSNEGDLTLAGELGLKLVEENTALATALANEQSINQSIIDELKLEQSINQSIIDELNFYRFKYDQLSKQTHSHERSTSPVPTTPHASSRRASISVAANQSIHMSSSQSVFMSPDDQMSMSQTMALASLRDLLRHELHDSPRQPSSPLNHSTDASFSSVNLADNYSTDRSGPTGDLHNDLQLFRRQLIKERRDLSVAIQSLQSSLTSISEAHSQSISQINQLTRQRAMMAEQLRSAEEAARVSREELEQTIESLKHSHRTELRASARMYENTIDELKEENASLSKELSFERAEQQRLRERFEPPPKYETPHHRRWKSNGSSVSIASESNSTGESEPEITVTFSSMTVATLSPTPLELYASAHHQRTHSLKDQIDSLTDNESTPVKARRAAHDLDMCDDDFSTPVSQRIQSEQSTTPSTTASATVPSEPLVLTPSPPQRSATSLDQPRQGQRSSYCVHCFPLECNAERRTRPNHPVRHTSWTTYFVSILALVALGTLGIKRGGLRHFR